jgi:phenylacetate-CoA ligase
VRRVPRHEHGCGWTWAYFPGVVLGRADFMVTIRGVNVYPTAVENLIGEVRGLSNHYELHVTRSGGMDRMLVKVEAFGACCDLAALSSELAAHLHRNLAVRLETEVVEPETLPRYQLKAKRVFDHRAREERPTVKLTGASR